MPAHTPTPSKGTAMLSITRNRSLATLAVVTGLLVSAAPAVAAPSHAVSDRDFEHGDGLQLERDPDTLHRLGPFRGWAPKSIR